ncbi:hypothetical protein [Luteithermobacter gelatinilyticus]|uniref:hypothetical protein n=1 Tax=Luteithermobacter gelatinilyticus TaxID=2582913 RepID=UPI0011068AFC|nr:hypothetical protein [Luteithermobacter gelatinilyticus]
MNPRFFWTGSGRVRACCVTLMAIVLTVSPFSRSGLHAAPGQPDISTARALFQNGNFTGAVKIAQTLKTPAGYNLAIQALLVRATFHETAPRREALIRKAHNLAQQAYEQFPDDTLTLLNVVVTTGLLSRLDEMDRPTQIQTARKSRDLLNQAERQAPLNPMVYATQAGWHSEVVYQAGPLAILLGASRERAQVLYRKALVLGPEELIIRLEYVKFSLRNLAEIDSPEDIAARLEEAEHHLNIILNSAPRMALDTLVQEQARDILAAVRTGKAGPILNTLARLDLIPKRR